MKPIATFVSDIHLSLTPPACRAETDWLKVQAGYLEQLKDIAQGSPILFGGDLFDRWNAPPELIHFALQHLPNGMLCVPGQHDLPNHRRDQMHRSGYGVLEEADKIVDLSDRSYFDAGSFVAYGFGWGQPILQAVKTDQTLQIAIVHQYIYLNQKSAYPGAPKEARLANVERILRTYDVTVIGDNHIPWISGNIINCGGFIRRKSDEIERPCYVGILAPHGKVERVKLDTSKDKFQTTKSQKEEQPFDMRAFLDSLKDLGEHGLNFREAVKRHLEKEDIDEDTKEIIYHVIDHGIS